LTAGAAYLVRGGAFLLRRPRLWPLVAAPILLNTLIFAALAAAAIVWLPGLLDRVLPDPVGYKQAIYWPLWVTAWAMIALGFALAFYLSASIVGGPFYGRLSRRILAELRGAPPASPGGLWADLVLPALNTLRRLAWMALLLPLSLIPLVGPVLAFVVAAFFFAMEFLDYPLDTVDPPLPFGARRRWAWGRRWTALGFGAAVTLSMSLPLLDLAMLPVAVAGATLLFHEHPDR
jgi:CysZ protein